MRDSDEVNLIATEALIVANKKAQELKKLGKASESLGNNIYGEMAMQIDVQSEAVVIDVFRSAEFPAVVISEEHGNISLVDEPKFTIFLDGFDGSSAFKESNGTARGGTMLAVYKGLNPKFKDYLFSGITDHKLDKVVVAIKARGISEVSSKKKKLMGSGVAELDSKTRIYIDEGIQNYADYPGKNKPYFYDQIKEKFNTKYLKSSAAYGFDLAVGDADLILEYGRKNNLEHMVNYPIAIESGGVMEFIEGGDLAPTRYSEYCVINGGYPAVVIASSEELANSARKFVKL